ncbi:hypothetical protein CSW98_15820 [Vibrio sp. HA2012]|uniref:phage terminase small subunit n=1 Tax=Vibrio sp. HA2012 TaxID=1971595 RepID=UPI000C2C12FB|nr:phage terminase small subunit [Vibrio sp. HA2012]PJC85294.1 hypothetical protein CSW98_15820 [Vibrio sp. HA2012]
MLSILLKRKAQEKEKAREEVIVVNTESKMASYTLADKAWEDTQASLKQDLSYLRTLAGSKEKNPYKEELIKKYHPLVERLLATHQGEYGHLDVMWWFFIWHIDLGLLENIHDDFRAAIGGGLETPTNWKMNGQTAYCGYVFKYAHEAFTEKKEFNREYLLNAVKDLLSGELATNAPLKVKMFRLVGDWHEAAGEKEHAYNLYELVMKLDPNSGGRKTKLNELKEELGYGDSN